MFKVGDSVRIKPEWCNPNGENLTWVVIEINGDNRCTIKTHLKGWALPVTEIVAFEMIELM